MPLGRVVYVANNSDMRKHMLSDDVADPARRVGAEIMASAKATAPVSDPEDKGAGDGTDYKDHFSLEETVVTIVDNGFANPRRAVNVVNDADYAAQVEFGVRPTPFGHRTQGGSHGTPSRTLGRAGAAHTAGNYKGGDPR